MDDALVLQAAQAMAERLRLLLDDFDAKTITLPREEAALMLGLVDGLAELLAAEAARKG